MSIKFRELQLKEDQVKVGDWYAACNLVCYESCCEQIKSEEQLAEILQANKEGREDHTFEYVFYRTHEDWVKATTDSL